MTQVADASTLRAIVLAFRDALADHRETINRLNVYPVPDGDTGTNMALTLDSVVAELDGAADDMAATCAAVSHGSLMGARGNSGVIMCQLLRGLSDGFAAAPTFDGPTFATALEAAAKAAYGAVGNPVEGTILTVAREASEAAVVAAADQPDLIGVVDAARAQAADALARTPEMLAVLADAGVVDAGGAGFLLFLDAALLVLDGRAIPEPDVPADLPMVAAPSASTGGDGPKDVSELRYEVMYFLDAPDDRIDGFKDRWAEIGDSIVVVGGDGTYNCHVHSDDIGAAIEAGIEVGRPYRIRITDLLEEVAESDWVSEALGTAPAIAPLPEGAVTAVVAVAVGDGVANIFRSLGVHHVVVGGQTMNPSTAQLLEAVAAIPCDEVLILPNNKNIIAVAEQVNGQSDKTVAVVPTRSIAEGFASLLEYDPQSSAVDNGKTMWAAAESVVAGEVTKAVRDATSDIGPVAEGEWIGLDRAGIRAKGDSSVAAATGLLDLLLTDDHEILTVIAGADASEGDTAAVVAWVEANHPDVEVETHDGGQPLYPFSFGIE
ncbi:MAG: DAK2 domain-containing protein [Acidimicrobiales bacterium]|nr:DAK2 domain-containing protein [Acidimicrobiales bacterium]